MPKALAGMGTGTNTANLQGPALPMDERTEDVEAWRERMDAKRATTRQSPIPLPAPPPAPAPVPSARRGRVPVDEAAQASARAVTAWFEGDSVAQIAEQIGRSATRVYQLLKAAGVDVKEPRQARPAPAPAPAPEPVGALSPVVVDEDGQVVHVSPYQSDGRNVDAAEGRAILAAYAAGASTPQIAEAHGRMPKTIRGVLDRAGVTRRDDRTYRSGGANAVVDAPELVAEVADLYGSGLTQAQVGERLGLSQRQVSGIMQRAGIPTRPDATGAQRTAKSRRVTRPAPPPVEIPAPPAPEAAPENTPQGQCSCWPTPMDDRHGHACDLYDDRVSEEPTRRAPLAGTLNAAAVNPVGAVDAAALAAELTRAIPPIAREDFTAVHAAASPTPDLIAAVTGRRARPDPSPGPSSLDLLDVVDVLHTALIALHEATSRLAAIARDLPPLRSTR